jgi:Family of unknown function (DUF6152)
MKIRLVASIALVVVLLSVSGTLFAHHGESAYNMDHPVEVKGCVVTKLMWTNPHTFLLCDAKDAAGVDVHWAAEGGSPNALTIRGWTQDTVQPGDVITLYLFQSKAGKPVGRIQKIVRADGKVFRDSILGYNNGESKGNQK